MSFVPSEIEARIAEAVEPTAGDILRAKELILRRVTDGPAARRDLAHVLHHETGIPEYNDRHDTIDAAANFDLEDPVILRVRCASAGEQALSELAASGLLAPLSDAAAIAAVPAQYHSTSGAVQVPRSVPKLAPAYELARAAGVAGLGRVLDFDIFTADLAELSLDDRARRSLLEALAAYRRGLWLSCASLLGAVSEAAWYAAGEQLRDLNGSLAKALDGDRTAQVITRVTELIRGARGPWGSAADELHSHAAYLRSIRNYGVHPRVESDPDLEAVFTEHGCALLLLETHRYLTVLAEATAVVVANVTT